MSQFQKYLEILRKDVEEIQCVNATSFLSSNDGIFIDIREPDEISQGAIPGALRLSRGFLEMRIESLVPNFDQTIVLYCAGGTRSLISAKSLQDLGFKRVVSLSGGFNQWKNLGLPVEKVETLSISDKERYSRHLLIPEVGEEGQLKLLKSRVLIVGAGGLGSPISLYLAAAGIGTLGIVDDDFVDRSNLQRQVIHKDKSVGQPKAASAKDTLQSLNPDINIQTYEVRLTSENVDDIFKDYDVIVDGSDNFATRYLINDACIKNKLPNVHGSIFRFEGQVSVFWPGNPQYNSPCYRCLFPEPPPPEQSPSCAEAGVIGTLPGVIGLIEATETIKLILSIGTPLIGRLLLYNGLAGQFKEIKFKPDPHCSHCRKLDNLPAYINYQTFCQNPQV